MPIGLGAGLGIGGGRSATSSGAPGGGGAPPFNVYSASLDGTDDQLYFGTSATDKDITLGTTDLAISMWFYTTSTAQQFLFHDTSASDRTFIHGGDLTVKGWGAAVVISSAYSINSWYQVVITRTSGTEKIYVNNVEKNSRSQSDTVKISNFGSYPTGAYFDGELDEISFHSAGLSPSQVSSIYNGGSPINIATGYNASGWWRMGDDSSGVSITDQIGSETLTANGASLTDTNVPT